MLEDTVLVGGIAFLALAGLAWLAMEKITNSELSAHKKAAYLYFDSSFRAASGFRFQLA